MARPTEPFTETLRRLLVESDHPRITSVTTFEEAGVAASPEGLVVTVTEGDTWYLALASTRGPGRHSKGDT